MARKPPLLLGGEQHGSGVAQHPLVGRGPVGTLLEVLERICALEPRIEQPADEHYIVLLGQTRMRGGNAATVAVVAGPKLRPIS